MNTALVLLATILAFAAVAHAKEKVIMCYFGSWAPYRQGNGKFEIENIDARLCTHVIYSFVGVNTDGTVKVLDPWQDLPDNGGKDGFRRFNKLRQRSPSTKILLAVGGWSEGSVKFSKVVGNSGLRSKFVKNVVSFVRKYGFDGFDVDWEYPNQRGGVEADKWNYVSLLKELRNEFNKHGLILTAAVGAGEYTASKSYLISEMSKHLHYINIMTYDFNSGSYDKTAMNAPLYPAKKDSGYQGTVNVDAAVKYWIGKGAPRGKIVLGVPFYGRGVTLANPKSNGIGARATGPSYAGPYTKEAGLLGYNEICEMIQQGGWTISRDHERRVPYMHKGNQWISYDDVTSMREKAEYVKKMGLAGAMMWSIETDDFRGKCGSSYPLLKALNKVLR